MAFYLEAMLACGLPHYFLTPAHLTMCADDTEGKHLAITDPPPLHATIHAETHLLLGTNATALRYPFVHDAASETSRILSARLADDQCRKLSHRFPALLLDVLDLVVVIHPRGFLALHSATSNSASRQPVAYRPILASEIDRRPVDELPAPASFYEEVVNTLQTSSGLNKQAALQSREAVARAVPSASRDNGRSAIAQPRYGSSGTLGRRVMRTRSAAVRANDIHRYIMQGMIANPRHQVHGPGSYTWLATYDTDLAQELELDHTDVVRMRGSGEIAENEDPSAVWWPERNYVNPVRQPEGDGRFEYLTNDDGDLAHLNFGGAQDNVLPHEPTATDIWNLRED
nr:hypothetical protein B0A51_18770 [Rachicladosporium sp. CCFEE 5018]